MSEFSHSSNHVLFNSFYILVVSRGLFLEKYKINSTLEFSDES